MLILILIGVIMAGSSKPKNLPEKTVEEVLSEQSQARTAKDMAREQFLADMSQIESSSGRNTDHKMMKGGMHAGEKAVGQYGLMPKTISEMGNRMEREDKLPSLLKMLRQSRLSEQEIADQVAQDPEMERAIADKLYDHVGQRFEGDPEKMSYAWEQGHNLKRISPADIETHPRTEKFRKLRSSLAKNE